MRVKDHQFPVVVQAYTPNSDQDVFVAEQVVHTQSEVDIFTSRYAGKLIKTRHLTDAEIDRLPKHYKETHPEYKRGRTSVSAGRVVLWVVVILIIAAIVIGLTTGWIQRTFHLNF